MFTWLLVVALGHPLVLPPDEDPAAWSSVLELVGLEPRAQPTDGPHVVVQPSGEDWRIRASDGEGEVREATIPRPTRPAEREAVAQLAASLLQELQAPALPPLPPLPEPPAPVVPSRVRTFPPAPVPMPVPAPVPAEPAPVAPEPEPVVVDPAPDAPREEVPDPDPTPVLVAEPSLGPVPEPVVAVGPAPNPGGPAPAATVDEAPPNASPTVGPFAWGSVGLHLRSTVLPAVAVGAWAGGETRWFRVGLGVEGTAPAGLTELQVEARVQRWSAWGGTWTRLGPVEAGVVGGGQRHRYVDDGGVDGVWVPTTGLSVALFPARTLRLEGRVHRDLRRVDVYVGSDRLQVAEPWSVQVGLAWVLFRRANRAGRR